MASSGSLQCTNCAILYFVYLESFVDRSGAYERFIYSDNLSFLFRSLRAAQSTKGGVELKETHGPSFYWGVSGLAERDLKGHHVCALPEVTDCGDLSTAPATA
jgi:hypothetical protein